MFETHRMSATLTEPHTHTLFQQVLANLRRQRFGTKLRISKKCGALNASGQAYSEQISKACRCAQQPEHAREPRNVHRRSFHNALLVAKARESPPLSGCAVSTHCLYANRISVGLAVGPKPKCANKVDRRLACGEGVARSEHVGQVHLPLRPVHPSTGNCL